MLVANDQSVNSLPKVTDSWLADEAHNLRSGIGSRMLRIARQPIAPITEDVNRPDSLRLRY